MTKGVMLFLRQDTTPYQNIYVQRPFAIINGGVGLIQCEAPHPKDGASRKGSFVHIVPLNPAYKAGVAGHVPVKRRIRP